MAKNIRIHAGSFLQKCIALSYSSLSCSPLLPSLHPSPRPQSVLSPTDITSSSVAISRASVFTRSIGLAIEIVALRTAMCYCNGPRLDPPRTDLLAVFSCKDKAWLCFLSLCVVIYLFSLCLRYFIHELFSGI